MNKNLNLVEILQDCPIGTMLYSPIFGQVEFVGIETTSTMSIAVKKQGGKGEEIFYKVRFSSEGKYLEGYPDAECLLFPSKDQRNWDEFKVPIPDKALVWCWDYDWIAMKVLRFYDAVNDSVFNSSGVRNTKRYVDNYSYIELFKDEEPEWATEARKNLKD